MVFSSLQLKKEDSLLCISHNLTRCVGQLEPPKESTLLRNQSTSGLLEVSLKYSQESNQAIQKQLEYALQSALKPMLNLQQYPSTLTRLFLFVQDDQGSLFSTLFNLSVILLIKSGLSLNATYVAFDLAMEGNNDLAIEGNIDLAMEGNTLTLFPNHNNTIRAVISIFDKKVLMLDNLDDLNSLLMSHLGEAKEVFAQRLQSL